LLVIAVIFHQVALFEARGWSMAALSVALAAYGRRHFPRRRHRISQLVHAQRRRCTRDGRGVGISPAGGRFEVHVSSLGDATSLRGGVLWATPLVFDPAGSPVATAKGPLLPSEGSTARTGYSVETTARIPEGALCWLICHALRLVLPQDWCCVSRTY
jgi:hypothetical protein